LHEVSPDVLSGRVREVLDCDARDEQWEREMMRVARRKNWRAYSRASRVLFALSRANACADFAFAQRNVESCARKEAGGTGINANRAQKELARLFARVESNVRFVRVNAHGNSHSGK